MSKAVEDTFSAVIKVASADTLSVSKTVEELLSVPQAAEPLNLNTLNVPKIVEEYIYGEINFYSETCLTANLPSLEINTTVGKFVMSPSSRPEKLDICLVHYGYGGRESRNKIIERVDELLKINPATKILHVVPKSDELEIAKAMKLRLKRTVKLIKTKYGSGEELVENHFVTQMSPHKSLEYDLRLKLLELIKIWKYANAVYVPDQLENHIRFFTPAEIRTYLAKCQQNLNTLQKDLDILQSAVHGFIKIYEEDALN